jgi:DNA replication and repair protein RecF
MQRPRDARRKSAWVGPHRDDLQLELGGHGVRKSASQGQHRSLVLSLKLAEMKVIQAMRGVRPVLLLDDVSSELDAERTAALFEQLRVEEGQVLLTTTRRELFDIEPLLGGRLRTASRRDFRMDQGVLSVVGGHP